VPDQCTYDYAIIRVVPKVEREEFVNVGVVVSCPERKFLQAEIKLDERRLREFDSRLDFETIRAHLETFPAICRGGEEAGPIGRLPQRERFYWLVAPRSTIIQVSPVHTGQCSNPELALRHLVQRMVATEQGAEAVKDQQG